MARTRIQKEKKACTHTQAKTWKCARACTNTHTHTRACALLPRPYAKLLLSVCVRVCVCVCHGAGVSARRKRSAPQNGSQSVAANYSGGPLSNVAADREFVLLGSAAIEEEHQAKAKRLCVR